MCRTFSMKKKPNKCLLFRTRNEKMLSMFIGVTALMLLPEYTSRLLVRLRKFLTRWVRPSIHSQWSKCRLFIFIRGCSPFSLLLIVFPCFGGFLSFYFFFVLLLATFLSHSLSLYLYLPSVSRPSKFSTPIFNSS